MATSARFLTVLVAVAALSLTACGQQTATPQTEPQTSTPQTEPSDGDSTNGGREVLRVGTTLPVTTLDYAMSNLGYAANIGNLVLEPLVVKTADGSFGPWLAESWSQPDETTYHYQLRSDVTFSDGQPLTADDVVTSLDYYRGEGSLNAYNFPAALVDITAVDDLTVEFSFTDPYPAWNATLSGAWLGIFQGDFFEANQGTFGQPGTGLIGTGPWKLDDLNPTSGATFSANENYWQDVPFPRIEFTFFSSETSMAVAFRTGEIDVAFPFDPRAFESTADIVLTTGPGSTLKVDFQMNTLVEPWSDIHVRRAVAYAIDRDALVSAAGGFASPSDTVLPRTSLLQLGTQEEVDAALAGITEYPFDLELAKAEMALSQYPDGVQVTLGSYPETSDLTQVVVAQLAEIGIVAEVNSRSIEQFIADVTTADRESILSEVTIAGGVGTDPGVAYDYMFGSANAVEGSWNQTNWSTPKVDELLQAGLREADPGERLAIYGELLKEFAEGLPMIPLYTGDETVAVGPGLEWPGFSADARFSFGPWPLWLTSAP